MTELSPIALEQWCNDYLKPMSLKIIALMVYK